MRWEEFGSGSIGDVWLVPAERMKGGKPHLVPLTELAIEQLPERKAGADGGDGEEFVFGKKVGAGYSGWSKAKAKLDRKVGFSDWSLHDFRRSLSTRLHEAMVEPHIVEAVLAHVGHKQGTAGVYNQATYR